MKKLQQQNGVTWVRVGAFFGLGILTGLMLLVAIARLSWHSKFYPGITIAGVEVAGLTREQARAKVTEAANNYQIKLVFNGSVWETPKGAALFEIEPTLNEAYHYGRKLLITDYLLLLVNKQTNFPLHLAEGKTDKLAALIGEISGAVELPPVEPDITIVNNRVEITNGIDGTLINGELLDKKIRETYTRLDPNPVVVPTSLAKRQLSETTIEELRAMAEKLLPTGLTLSLDDEQIVLNGVKLVSFLATDGEGGVEVSRLTEYVSGLSESLRKEPQDAKFEFSDGKVQEFLPGRDGVEVNVELTTANILTKIQKLLDGESKSENVEIAVTRTPPKITTEKVNELGIRERIGRGESYYNHSIPNRIYNVALASSRINSALVPPGEEVSFNGLVGEVSSGTGYRPAYIISGGRTVLGDGGGLCQVSTTMFRAAMSAGLPILERWGHAYRVSYYELNSKPGVDATVIAPSKDFRFRNDTPGHILIQTINEPTKQHLIIEIYGTSDGRVATLSEPKVWGITPPLPTIYQDDPTLPAGTLKQVDWAASGAKASFEYKVVRNGETLQDKTFSTTYRPWASVFMRGTGI